jgi:ubiquinone/menaquinone biosynthesis C-methylase UbiE
MKNPWLEIPLADYEAHMNLPEIAQAEFLGDVFRDMLKRHSPHSVAILGCAGGNGFEHLSAGAITRVVGVDINPEYIEEARRRFKDPLPGLELFAGNIETDKLPFEPVDLVFAGLVLEYVDVGASLQKIGSMLNPGGVLGTVLQLPHGSAAAVTPSPFSSIQTLSPFIHLVPPGRLKDLAGELDLLEIESRTMELRSGKRFQVQAFRLGGE